MLTVTFAVTSATIMDVKREADAASGEAQNLHTNLGARGSQLGAVLREGPVPSEPGDQAANEATTPLAHAEEDVPNTALASPVAYAPADASSPSSTSPEAHAQGTTRQAIAATPSAAAAGVALWPTSRRRSTRDTRSLRQTFTTITLEASGQRSWLNGPLIR